MNGRTFEGNEGSPEGDDYGGRVKLGVLDVAVKPVLGYSMHVGLGQGSSRKAKHRSSTVDRGDDEGGLPSCD